MPSDSIFRNQPSLFDEPSLGNSNPPGSANHFPGGEAGESKPNTFWEKNVQPSIDQADDNADEDWREVAQDCLHMLAETMDEITADDLVEALEKKEVQTHNPSATGPVFIRARNRGWIKNADRQVQSRIPRRHRKITVWKSLLRETNVSH